VPVIDRLLKICCGWTVQFLCYELPKFIVFMPRNDHRFPSVAYFMLYRYQPVGMIVFKLFIDDNRRLRWGGVHASAVPQISDEIVLHLRQVISSQMIFCGSIDGAVFLIVINGMRQPFAGI